MLSLGEVVARNIASQFNASSKTRTVFGSERYGESIAVTGDQDVVVRSKERERWWLRQPRTLTKQAWTRQRTALLKPSFMQSPIVLESELPTGKNDITNQ